MASTVNRCKTCSQWNKIWLYIQQQCLFNSLCSWTTEVTGTTKVNYSGF